MISSSLLRKFRKGRAGFLAELGEAFNDGQPTAEFFLNNAQYYEKRKNKLHQVYSLLYARLDEPGAKLSTALEVVVEPEDMLLLSAVDKGSDIAKATVLKNISERIVIMEAMKKQIFLATMAPMIVLPIVLIFMVMMGAWIIPEQISVFPLERWNKLQLSLYYISYAIVHYWYILAIIICFMVSEYAKSFSNWAGEGRNSFNRIWILGLPHKLHNDYIAANFVTGLAQLLEDGADLKMSLEKLGENGTRFVQWHIDQISSRLWENAGNHEWSFDTKLLSEELHRRLTNYSKLKNKGFVEGLINLGTTNINNVQKSVEASIRKLKFVTMVVGFLIIGYTYGAYLSIQFGMTRYLKEISSEVERESI
ncbi:hypothetical protein [Janthinobacterium sp. FW305-128]|uniref:hypothetical protein n=1 Tax=Janthinobacterium sp. FW305-128 TaxID=2775055 RepID=UPI001E5E2DC4|nr:hypothetical protein [Janthinobacterium sp. FW305-128]MCC7684711.1 type II secretion system F family protein [Janthinobacterium sp. FW305-128]